MFERKWLWLRLFTTTVGYYSLIVSAVVAEAGGVDMGMLLVFMRLFVAVRPLLFWVARLARQDASQRPNVKAGEASK